MPPLPPIPDTAQFEMVYTSVGEICENVFHVHTDPASTFSWSQSRLATYGDAFISWWTANLKTHQGADVNLVKVRCRDIGSVNQAVTDRAGGLPSPGTRAGTTFPNNVTVAVSWRTGFAGRSNRGRTFHIGLMEDMVLGNAVTAANLTSLQSIYDALRTAIGNVEVGGFSHLVVASRKLQSTQVITSCQIDPFVDSQRRRLPEHNRHR